MNRRIALGTLLCVVGFGPVIFPAQRAAADAEDAKKYLKAMADYMVAQQAISFDYSSSLEVVTKDNQKLALESSGSVHMDRPNKVRFTRTSGHANSEIVFDSKTVTMFGKNKNVYAQKELPGSIDNLVDELRDKLDKPLPGADLLLTSVYDELMQDVSDIKDLGNGVVNGVKCNHFAFRKPEVDWQIWIADGAHPYPCKYVVTSKQLDSSPQYSIQIINWKTGKAALKDDFKFMNTTSAKKVEDSEMKLAMNELPSFFHIGEK